MHADYTRILRDRRYDAVLTQQGRVQLDSDTNEAQLVALDHRRTAAIDALGPAAAPKLDAGFAISAAAGGDLSISPGSFLLRGIRVRNPAPSLRAAQPFVPDARPLADLLPVGAAALVYLHAWHRHITADQDPSIREPALGGPDTTTRLQPLWQVGVLPVPLNQFAPNLPAPSDAAGVAAAAEALRRLAAQGLAIPLAAWQTLIPPLEDPRRGWLTASTDTPGADDNPCELPPPPDTAASKTTSTASRSTPPATAPPPPSSGRATTAPSPSPSSNTSPPAATASPPSAPTNPAPSPPASSSSSSTTGANS